jgi:acyl-CoA dehydrogenase
LQSKLATQRAAFEVMDACLQLHGGAGYMREYEIRAHTGVNGRGSGVARDACLGPIGGGTDEVMKEILGKVMGL